MRALLVVHRMGLLHAHQLSCLPFKELKSQGNGNTERSLTAGGRTAVRCAAAP